MADPPPPLALSTTSAFLSPLAPRFWGARTGSPLTGSDPKGAPPVAAALLYSWEQSAGGGNLLRH